jgi:type IV pilus biogenesis/stability protein PilW
MTARIARVASFLLLGVAALALSACSSSGHSARKKNDASNYNMQLGMAYLNQGDLGLAKEKLDRAVTENPGDPNVHSAMAMLQDRLGHPEAADKEFKAALNLGPRSPDVLNNYAVYLCRTGRTDEGVKSFEEAAHNALYRTPEAAYTNAGVCLRGAKRDTQAAMSFQRALQLRISSRTSISIGAKYRTRGRRSISSSPRSRRRRNCCCSGCASAVSRVTGWRKRSSRASCASISPPRTRLARWPSSVATRADSHGSGSWRHRRSVAGRPRKTRADRVAGRRKNPHRSEDRGGARG